jgi:oxygen-independent coproporphyrinogen-3 oxidase
MRAVRLEVQANAADLAGLRVVAVRFGGGIASYAGEDIWETMRCLRSCLDIANDAPVTMRSSVSNISGANMTWFKRAGVSRFDFEIMSLNQMDFFLLNHTDSLTDFTTICDYILRPQQTNLLGLVLVYGHSAKTHRASIQNFRATLFAALRSHAVHLKLLRYDAKSATASAESGIAEEHLASAREILAENGFCEYIPLHFAPAGFEDKYNLLRVSKHDSDNSVAQLGFGLNARTVIDGIVATNTSDLALYLQKSADYQAITASVQTKSAPLAVLSP